LKPRKLNFPVHLVFVVERKNLGFFFIKGILKLKRGGLWLEVFLYIDSILSHVVMIVKDKVPFKEQKNN